MLRMPVVGNVTFSADAMEKRVLYIISVDKALVSFVKAEYRES